MLKFPLPKVPDNLSIRVDSLSRDVYEQLCYVLDQKKLCMQLYIYAMERLGQPNLHPANSSMSADQLLSKFSRFNCTVEVLILLLEECSMHELLYLFKKRVPVQITEQPPAQIVAKNHQIVELTCSVMYGFPEPTFQWFFNDCVKDGATQSTLVIPDLRNSDAGIYRCEISQLCRDGTIETISSMESKVTLEKFPPCTVKEPFGCRLKAGDFAELRYAVEGNPTPTLQWFKNDHPLPQKESAILQIICASFNDSGRYKCLAKNSEGEVCSKEVLVEVASFQADEYLPPSFPVSSWERNIPPHQQYTDSNHGLDSAINLPNQSCNVMNIDVSNIRSESSLDGLKNLSVQERVPRKYTASSKQALLVGNWTYGAHKLEKVRADVKTLHDILYEHKFDAISLCNLNKMDVLNAADLFCQLLLPGAYVVVYFAGHGIHRFNDYLLPVDLVIDSDYSVRDLVDVNEIIAKIQKTSPKMLVVLLDMCRTIPTKEKNPRILSEIPKEIPRDSRTNLVIAWATSENSSAYEMNHEVNGIFMTYLKREMENSKLSVTDMLERLKQHSKREIPFEARDQTPATFSSLADPLSLHDPIDDSMIGGVEWIASQMMASKWRVLPQNQQITVEVNNQPVVIHVQFSMMDDCFSNGLRVELVTEPCEQVSFHSASIFPSTLELEFSCGWNSGNCVITIHKLHSLTEDASLFLNIPESVGGTVQINLGQPLIAKARLAINNF